MVTRLVGRPVGGVIVVGLRVGLLLIELMAAEEAHRVGMVGMVAMAAMEEEELPRCRCPPSQVCPL